MMRLLVTSGRGPAECRMAVKGVLRALIDEAHATGLAADAVAAPDRDGLGPASAIVVIHGEGACAFAARWTGTIQWIAQSPVRPHHKRKNWFAGVVALPSEETRADLNPMDVRFETLRAGGPGGQHQNKTESAVRATHLPTGLSVTVRQERSQHRNKALAIERLAKLIAAGCELDRLEAQQRTQSAHEGLERGRPVRRIKGHDFKPA